MSLLSEIIVGGIGGLIGAIAMSSVMLVGKQLGFVRTPVPNKIVRSLESRTEIVETTSPSEETILAQGIHLGIGGVYGLGYGLLRKLLRAPGILLGPLYGLGIYIFNEIFAGPALKLTPKPENERPITVARRVFMHVLYGFSLYLVSERLSRGISSR